MQPILFEPIVKRARWGGRRLSTLLGKPIGSESDYAESWEICHQPDANSVVAEGPLKGRTMSQLMADDPDNLLGRHAALSQFPLLIKYLDANDWLSLQVHPNDDEAQRFGDGQNGKTEAWVIMAAQPNSRICTGYRSGVTKDEIERRLHDGSIEECLHLIPVSVGDCVFVPAGTVHALGPGIVLAEIQEQSDLTFRLYDWGRLGADGQPRPLHIEDAMACTNLSDGPAAPVMPETIQTGSHAIEQLVDCSHFTIRRHRLQTLGQIATDGSFRILMVVESEVQLTAGVETIALPFGSTVLIPAACEEVTVQPAVNGEPATILEIGCP